VLAVARRAVANHERVTQSIVNVVDFGDGPQDAVNRPRVHDEGEGLLADSRIARACGTRSPSRVTSST